MMYLEQDRHFDCSVAEWRNLINKVVMLLYCGHNDDSTTNDNPFTKL